MPEPDTGLLDNRDVNETKFVLLAKWLLEPADPPTGPDRVQLDGPNAGRSFLSVPGRPGCRDYETRMLLEGVDYECSDGWLDRRLPDDTVLLTRLPASARGEAGEKRPGRPHRTGSRCRWRRGDRGANATRPFAIGTFTASAAGDMPFLVAFGPA